MGMVRFPPVLTPWPATKSVLSEGRSPKEHLIPPPFFFSCEIGLESTTYLRSTPSTRYAGLHFS